MRVSLVLCVGLVLACATGLRADTIVRTPVADLGLYGQEPAPTTAPGVHGTQRGAGGRFDVTDGGESALLTFDLSGAVPVDHVIVSAKLEFFAASSGGWAWDDIVDVYPMAKSWVEGAGTSAAGVGSTGFPWGPAAVGDSVMSFQSVETVGPGDAAPWDSQTVAYTGVEWAEEGAMGIGTDMLDRLMSSTRQTESFRDDDDHTGQLIASLPMNAEGLAVLTEWADGSLVNNGLHVFFSETFESEEFGLPHQWRATSREFGAVPPKLTLETRLIPEPSTVMLVLVGLCGLAFFGRRSS